MRYRKLGHTGFDVSTIGFGTWQIGGGRWQAEDPEQSVALLRHALDRGINLFDVSAAYGLYRDDRGYLQSRSQELLGRALEGRREGVVVNLKIGHLDEVTHRVDFTPAALYETFQHSLRRLRTTYADTCLIHAPSLEDIRRGRAIAVLETLRAQGRVGAVGYSLEEEPEHVDAALEQDIDVIELQYNLLSSACAPAIERARRHGVAILASGVFKRGLLTGRFQSAADLPREDDYWAFNLRYCPGKLDKSLERVRGLLQSAGSPAALRRRALVHVLSTPGVTSAILGLRSREEIDEALAIAEEIGGEEYLPPNATPAAPAGPGHAAAEEPRAHG